VSVVPVPDELKPILTQNGGMFTTAQANKVGVSGERLRLLVKSGDLERAHFGTQFGNRPRREI
jgi:hypothetical protein